MVCVDSSMIVRLGQRTDDTNDEIACYSLTSHTITPDLSSIR